MALFIRALWPHRSICSNSSIIRGFRLHHLSLQIVVLAAAAQAVMLVAAQPGKLQSLLPLPAFQLVLVSAVC
jgi:hypothetical protein